MINDGWRPVDPREMYGTKLYRGRVEMSLLVANSSLALNCRGCEV
jgi:hypothetical protein